MPEGKMNVDNFRVAMKTLVGKPNKASVFFCVRSCLHFFSSQLAIPIYLHINEICCGHSSLLGLFAIFGHLPQAGHDCQSFYPNYKQGVRSVPDGSDAADLDCQAVVFFYRINRMLELSCNALRQQIVNTEQRRLEREVKELLNDWSADPERKRQHLTGRQVELAEELGKWCSEGI